MVENFAVQIIVAVTVLAVLLSILFLLKTNICRIEDGKINCGFRFHQTENILLARAIECSYYRCMKGCDDPKITTIELGDFKCYEYCEGLDGKICGDEAKKHIIEIELNKETKLFSGQEIDLEGKYACLLKAKTENDVTIRTFVHVDENIVEETGEEEDSVYCFDEDNTFKEITVKPGKYYIWTNDVSWTGAGGQTVVWSEHPFEKCCQDCSCPNKNMCEYCRESGLNENCYFDEYFYKKCNSFDQPPSCSPFYSSTIETNCRSFCEEICEEGLSRCYCTYDHCATECDCKKISSCEDYLDPISCRTDQCNIGSCEWEYVPSPGSCYTW